MIYDTHVHLNDEAYADNIDLVVEEAKEQGIKAMFVMGIDKETSLKAIELSKIYQEVYAFIGLHPSELLKNSSIEWIEELAQNDKVIGIGEIGLDYYWDKSYKELQKEIFIKQIEISKKLNLPISVHSRDANQDTLDIIKKYHPKGIIHCYSGSVEMAREFVKQGFLLGIGGVVTFKNSKVIKEVVSEIDIDYLVTETDGPYLAPSPYRGTCNYPKYVSLIVEEIARIKNLSVEDVERKVEENIQKLFNI